MSDKKYNWNVAGHKKVLSEIEADLQSGNLPNAYLFAGPPHVGKFTLARRLAQILQCDADGCGNCQVCINIEKGYHPDTIELQDDGESLKIEPMREILARLATTANGKYKIFLVKNIERMTLETANVLLKTMEEPPSKVIFLFTTGRLEDILQTVLSRVRPLKFRSLPSEEIMAFLKGGKLMNIDDEKTQKAVDLSFGLPGRAVRFLEDEEYFEQVQAMFEKVRNVLKNGDVVDKFALVNEATQAPKTAADEKMAGEFFDIFLLALRYTMLHEAEGGKSSQKLQRTLQALLRAQEAVRLQKRNVNARLLFENIILNT